jgi:hypothetical protein
MSTGLGALAQGVAQGRATVVARGVASVPAADIIAFMGQRSGETITYLDREIDAMPLHDLEWVHHKMTNSVWPGSEADETDHC